MKTLGYRQVTWTRLLIAAAVVPALSACGGNCHAHLTLINASGLAIASGSLRPPGARETISLGSLPSPGTSDYLFSDIDEGAYAIEIRFADGSSRRDTTLGYLTHGMASQDTLVVQPFGDPMPLALKQTPGVCWEAPRVKTVIREILKKVF
ncbi:MAG TPA: hypothetical protein VK465_14800 [Fibrobacteria bacterium]|nr:hypothetical protein [Fibrobacteria bacterium]